MRSRYSTIVRMLGLALVVLAVSPVTAPFSTIDLIGILTGAKPSDGTSLQSKKAPDEPVCEADGQPTLVVLPDFWLGAVPVRVSCSRCRSALHLPLRI
jgi:hypothetical protein